MIRLFRISDAADAINDDSTRHRGYAGPLLR
jgi:hypothetical protein